MLSQLAAGLPKLAAQEQWLPLLRATTLSLALAQHGGELAADFVKAKGTTRVQGQAAVMYQAAAVAVAAAALVGGMQRACCT